MAERYRVAVIGRTGRGDYGHGLDIVWKDIDGVQVVAVADEDEKGRREAAARLGGVTPYGDYRAMLEKERPQIGSVAPRWLDCHRDMVVACAEHGCHILLEKPMARNLEEADEMVAACERTHVKLAIAHQARHSPRIDRARELIAEGALGDILEIQGRGKEDRRGGGEDMMVLGTHSMDLMRWLCGDAQWCLARVLKEGRPIDKSSVVDGAEGIGPLAGDEIHAWYGLRPGTVGSFGTQRARHGAGVRWGIRVYGTRGVLTIGGPTMPSFPDVFFSEDPSWMGGPAKWVPVTSAGPGKPETQPDAVPQRNGNARLARDLIRAIESDTQPLGSVYDARAALEMVLAPYESQRLGKTVPLPLANRRHPLSML